ncbi:MAG: hypothetical protein WBF79_15100 [Rhodococcus sp. (in: high G+C Gram-positive bacteria)]
MTNSFDPEASSRARIIFERGTTGPLSTVDGVIRPIVNQDPFVWIDDAMVDNKVAFPILLVAVSRIVSISMTEDPR